MAHPLGHIAQRLVAATPINNSKIRIIGSSCRLASILLTRKCAGFQNAGEVGTQGTDREGPGPPFATAHLGRTATSR